MAPRWESAPLARPAPSSNRWESAPTAPRSRWESAPLVDDEPSTFRPSRALSRGTANLKGLGYGLVALGADAVGANRVGDWALEGYKDTQELAQSLASDVPSYKDIRTDSAGGFLTDAGKYAVDAVFENLPMFLPSLATGGVGALVARKGAEKVVQRVVAEKLAEGLTKEAAEKYAAQVVLRRVAIGSTAGAAPASIGMEAGSIYPDIVEQTGKRGPGAAAIALAGGTAAGALDVLPQTAILKKVFGPVVDEVSDSLVKRLGKEGAKLFVMEAGTEGLQTIIEQVTVQAAGGKQPINWDEVIDATLKGGIAGGGLGVVGQGISEIRRPAQTQPPSPPPPPPAAPILSPGDIASPIPNPALVEARKVESELASEGAAIVAAALNGQPLPTPGATPAILPAQEQIGAAAPPTGTPQTSQPAVILQLNGNPFPNRMAAFHAGKSRKSLAGKQLEVIEVAGGFGLVPRETPPVAAPAPSPVSPVSPVPAPVTAVAPVVTPPAASGIVEPVSTPAAPEADIEAEVTRRYKAGTEEKAFHRAVINEERGAPASVEDIHAIADGLKVPWDDALPFMARTKELTGKNRLDDLSDAELTQIRADLRTNTDAWRAAPPASPITETPVALSPKIPSQARAVAAAPAQSEPIVSAPQRKAMRVFDRAVSKASGKGVIVTRDAAPGARYDPLFGRVMLGADVDSAPELAATIAKQVKTQKRPALGKAKVKVDVIEDDEQVEVVAADAVASLRQDMAKAYALLECVS